MTGKVKFSSKRLFLTLMLCACSVILLQNNQLAPNSSFLLNIVCIFGGLGVCFLFFLPSLILHRRSGADFLMLARQRTPGAVIPLAVFYAAYFAYTAAFFLIPYTDMFQKKYFSEISRCVIGFFIIAACVYAAAKGANVISRFGIFLFVFAMLTNVLMFGGSLSSLEFLRGSFALGDFSALPQNLLYFVTPAFIAVLYACLAGETRNLKLRHPLIALLLTGVKYSLVLFFIRFALGEYAKRQEYPAFVLSRVAHFGGYAGVESFYLALATMSVFMIISLIFCCVCRAAGKSGNLRLILAMAAFVFTLTLSAKYNSFMEDLLTNEVIFIILTFAAAVIIPTAYLFVWRKFNAEKNKHIITES